MTPPPPPPSPATTVNPRPPIRVLVGKAGLDGHDRGVKVVARALRDAGMEVIYTGLHQTPEQIAAVAMDEDVDVVGISILSGAHMAVLPRLLDAMRERGGDDIGILVGGVIPDVDAAALRAMGIADIVGQETPLPELVERVRRVAQARRIGVTEEEP